MLKVRVRNGELTIPLTEEIQEKLDVHDGDELEARVFKGISFTPRSAEARLRAWDDLFSILERVRLRPGQQPLTEEEIVEEVHSVRRARRERQRHD